MFNDKIIAFQLLTRPDDERERKSVEMISRIADINGVTYNKIVNSPNTVLPPSDNCMYPERISMTGSTEDKGSKFTPGTYGCFTAHKNCISSINTNDDTLYIIFEADAKLEVSPNVFINIVNFTKPIMVNNDLHIFNFGKFGYHDGMKWFKRDVFIESDSMYGTHCYMLLKQGVLHLQKCFKEQPWGAYDIWLRERCNIKSGFYYKPVCNTYEGESLIDRNF